MYENVKILEYKCLWIETLSIRSLNVFLQNLQVWFLPFSLITHFFSPLYLQGTADDVVDCSHGKQLWELCKEKYEPLWVQGGNHCDLELYPEYIKHLKKFIIAIEKSAHLINESMPSTNQTENTRNSVDCQPRESTYQREKSRSSTDQREKPRASIDQREKSVTSIDRREKSRKSMDYAEKANNNAEQPEKARNSIDRLGTT